MGPVRFAFRHLRHDRGYALTFIVTLGLGIGVATTIFSAVDAILLKPLPYQSSDRLVYLQQAQDAIGVDSGQFSLREAADYRAQATSLDAVVEYTGWSFTLLGQGSPRITPAGLVTSEYFRILGLGVQLGRPLQPEDDGAQSAPVAILTDEYWRRAFGSDPGVVGRVVELAGVATSDPTTVRTTIVGVLKPVELYAGASGASVLANYAASPYFATPEIRTDRGERTTDIYARLAAGVSLNQARAELSRLARDMYATFPAQYPKDHGFAVRVTPWQAVLAGNARRTLLLSMAAVALVLLVAVANTGNLTLASLLRRRQELSVRVALGATSSALRRDLLVEHLMLAAGGALLGLTLAWSSTGAIRRFTEALSPRAAEVGVNLTVLTFSLVAGFVAALLFAWLPPIPGMGDQRSDGGGSGTSRTTAGRGFRRAQRLLVVTQMSVSFVVLTGGGLVLRSLVNVANVDLGLDASHVIAVTAPNYTRLTAGENRALFDQVLARVRRYPGVTAVATAAAAPMDDSGELFFRYQTDAAPEAFEGPLHFNTISPDYFTTLAIPLATGRPFNGADVAGAPPVVVVNERLAALALHGRGPIGHHIRWSFNGTVWTPWRTIVGVAGNIHQHGPQSDVVPTVYESSGQSGVGSNILIRTTGDGHAAANEAVRTIGTLDPRRPITRIQSLEEALDGHLVTARGNALLFGACGLVALAIAAVGIGGVLAFAVSERTREFGIRAALGASPNRLLRAVLAEGLGLAAVGLGFGVLAAALVTRGLAAMLFNVVPLDGLTWAVSATVLIGMTVVASWLPARRAALADPASSVRRP
jgi:putative ABC transport system permease protein